MSREGDQHRIGEIRPSQLLYTFGIGSIVDLPNVSALVMGVDDWDVAHAREIGEDRLLQAVRKRLGPQVSRLRSPPLPPDEGGSFDPFDASRRIGVPVAPFPRWMRCPACSLVAPLASELFDLRENRWNPDRIRYVHHVCNRAKAPDVLPARFLVACPNGHLDDFPWVGFVHDGAVCPGPLKLFDSGPFGEAVEVIVKCEGCGSKKSIAQAFSEAAPAAVRRCTARRPQLRDHDPSGCDRDASAVLLGASNFWFPATYSALSVPAATDRLGQLVEQHWTVLAKAVTREILSAFREIGTLAAFAPWSDDELWEAVERKRRGPAAEVEGPVELKRPEYEAFVRPDPARQGPDFRLREVDRPPAFEDRFDQIVLVERLREVRALIGFTRIDPPGPEPSEDGGPRLGAISRTPPTWVPAAEVRGEGVFLRFSEAAIREWLARPAVRSRQAEFEDAWRRAAGSRILPPFPGLRFVLLHSFAHALIRQFSLECGYGMSSIRERIYADEGGDGAEPMAGVLLYTAAPDSEGTLGGLVALGEPANLGRHLAGVLEQAGLCSSDPLCAEHSPNAETATLHGAACHGCLFAPETSCEAGNRWLDRLCLTAAFGRRAGAYFGAEE